MQSRMSPEQVSRPWDSRAGHDVVSYPLFPAVSRDATAVINTSEMTADAADDGIHGQYYA